MSRYSSVWLTCCLFALVAKAARAEEECLGRGLLRPLPTSMYVPTDCLMDCTMRTYVKKRILHHRPSIQFEDSQQDDQGRHCWTKDRKCVANGELFDRAFVILPVNITSAEQVEVSMSGTKLSVHASIPLISSSCGLLYDVTQHFTTENSSSSFCIQLHPQQHKSSSLTCPPYLLVLWKTNTSQALRQSGG